MSEIFEPKPFPELVAGMVERLRLSTDQLTDFNVGSVTRSLLEACAVELEDYYRELYFGLLEAIPAACYIGFGFDLRPAVAASGVATLTRTQVAAALTVPAGTRFTAPHGAVYTSSADATFAIGTATVDVVIVASEEGAAGNAGPGVLTASFNGVAASNASVLSGGTDAETSEQRAERFAAFIQALARGTPAALEYAALLPVLYDPVTGVLAERVQRAAVMETPGYVELYIHNGSYGASEALLAAVQRTIDGERDGENWIGGYRPAGMRVVVRAMADKVVNVSFELGGTGTTADVAAALGLYLRSVVYGDRVRPIDLINIVFAVDGVTSVVLLDPVADVVVGPGEVLLLGTLGVTWIA